MVWRGTSARAADLLQRPLAVNVPLVAGDEPPRYIYCLRYHWSVYPGSESRRCFHCNDDMIVGINMRRWPA